MNFYFEAAKTLDRLDAKEGSIKGVLATLPEKDRKRTAALVIETLKCKVIVYPKSFHLRRFIHR
jgi:25S rRNA (cytosine2278-C5)-methyltransferase